MKKIVLIYLFIVFSGAAFSQEITKKLPKLVVDTSVYGGKWQGIYKYAISNDGKYAEYCFVGLPNNGIVVCATDNNWKLQFSNNSVERNDPCFALDSKYFLFVNSGDSLAVVELGKSKIKYTPDVYTFNLITEGTDKYIAYTLKSLPTTLKIKRLNADSSLTINNVLQFSPESGGILFQTKTDTSKIHELKWIDISTGIINSVWRGRNIEQFVSNNEHTKCAFLSSGSNVEKPEKIIWCYDARSGSAYKLASDSLSKINNKLEFATIQNFSKDNKWIFFSYKETPAATNPLNHVSLDIWSYKDPELQSMQLKELGLRNYLAVINIGDKKLVQLERNQDEHCQLNKNNDSLIIVRCYQGSGGEWNWNPADRAKIILESASTGSRKSIFINVPDSFTWYSLTFSPDGKYLICYEPYKKKYISYELISGKIQVLRGGYNEKWTTNMQDDLPSSDMHPIGYGGWLKNESQVFIYAKHDIFLFDVTGKKSGINVTNGFGEKNGIIFRIPSFYKNYLFQSGEKIVLQAFNENNKDDGFYSISVGSQRNPEKLSTGPYLINGKDESQFNDHTVLPARALNSEGFVLIRQRADQFPNLYFTKDFKNYKALSDFSPQRNYNWLTSELITWKTFNKSLCQGILYKPENFDPRKKYPLIIQYYEKNSERLHEFPLPDANGATIDIPSFVSDGYLVLLADVHYPLKTGQGKGVYNSIVSAAEYMATMPWVNAKKIGINGHSRGGYQTNYLITHTKIFAAAISASGYSDLMSLYGSFYEQTGQSRQTGFETGPQRIGATLWEKPAMYLENSPVLFADKVTTPLLMMNNKSDDDIPFAQGAEFFTALRRLHKKVWMLQYDGEGHELSSAPAIDFSIRMKQFFDFYLKDATPARWMAEPMPANLKGVDTGLDLETRNSVP